MHVARRELQLRSGEKEMSESQCNYKPPCGARAIALKKGGKHRKMGNSAEE